MKRLVIAASLLALVACTPTPKPGSPEAVVGDIYKTLVDGKGDKTTPRDAIPMSDDLKALVAKVDALNVHDAPVFDGDLAGNCQDCAGFSGLKIAPPPAASSMAGHALVEAKFSIGAGATAQAKSVMWDMIKTPAGARIDNITSDGFDVREIATKALAADAAHEAAKVAADGAVLCMAHIRLMKNSVSKAEATKLDEAITAWDKITDGVLSPDELAQYLASSQAVESALPAAELKAKAADCVTRAPK